MKKSVVILMILLLMALVSLGAAQPNPEIQLNTTHFDFGDINPDKGEIMKEFFVKNVGNAPLEVFAVSTSCGCTTAKVEKTTIKPGSQTKLLVTYDPLAHGGTVGAIKRVVYIQSNDPEHEEVELELVGNVLASSKTPSPTTKSQIISRDTDKTGSYTTATIYYNEACAMCAMYIDRELIPILDEAGIKNIIKKDYINEKQNRAELNKLNKSNNVPPNLQGHFMTFIDDKVIFGGHVPEHIVVDVLNEDFQFEKLLVLQDDMDNAKSYIAWGFKGESKEYAIDTPIREYMTWFSTNKDQFGEQEVYQASWSFQKLFPLIVVTGFLDGINPCAFSVLIFFIVFLFTLKKATRHIIWVGLLFIAMIFLAYMLIGLGIVHAFVLAEDKHLIAKISAGLMIVLGLVNIKDYFWYGKWFSLSPHINADFYKRVLSTLTIPSVMIVGFLVGLCTFPCSGGIYVAILGILAAKTTYLKGLYYMLFYNVMFVLPLFMILSFLLNRRTLGLISRWENANKKLLKLAMGVVMIALGIGIFVWVL